MKTCFVQNILSSPHILTAKISYYK